MSNESEIYTIAGARVRVEYCADADVDNCCDKCCFCNGSECDGLGEDDRWPCEKFDPSTAYFVPAEKPKPATIAEEVPAEDTEADLQAEIERKYKADTTTMKTRDQYAALARHFAEWERARIESELRLAWGKISKDPFDVDSVFRELLEHLKQ